jgi:hypothetical protein
VPSHDGHCRQPVTGATVAPVCRRLHRGIEPRETQAMKTNRTRLLTLALAFAAAGCWLGSATDAHAQQVTYYYASPAPQTVYYPAETVYYQTSYQRVYQGTSWYWSPTAGWQSYNRYVDVPYQVPTYVYPQTVPVTTTYYW